MKKLNFLAASILALSIGIGGVNAATASRSIDKSKCDTVYTNYYFFVDIGSKNYYNQKDLSSYTNNTIAEYHNNSWQISDFDPNNIGYGQVKLGKGTTTSSDGITSMSLTDFWTYKKKAYNTNGAFSDGPKNYVVSHDWYKVTADNQEIKQSGSTNLSGQSVSALTNASIDADITFTRRTSVNPNSANPFKIQVYRQYKGYLTGKPLNVANKEQYVQPALYYIQYCSPKQNTPVEPEKEYNVTYHGNGSNVTGLPNNQIVKEGKCFYVGNAPKRNGYKFLGWSENSNAKTPDSKYKPGKQICNLTRDIDLYAIWEEIEPDKEYNVRYHGNGSNVTDVPNDQTVKDGKCFYVGSAPKREEYKFLGWSTNSNTTTPDSKYAPGKEICDLKSDLDLYAVWERIVEPVGDTYKVVYKDNANGDRVISMPNDEEISIENDYYISNNNPVREGYEFLGWSTDANADRGDDEFKGGSLYQDRKDLVLYAIWKKKENPAPVDPVPDNPKTGITDYLIPFGSTIGASGLGLQVLKKKKSFKQF